MKNLSIVENAIRTSHEVFALPRLIADWNYNRYIDVTVDNIPSEDTDGFDIELFPIESIVEPVRPTKGAAKAILGQSLVADDYNTLWRPRFYTASVDDKYKYWVSPELSDGSGNISKVAPHVIYSEPVEANKIVVNIENSWATPTSHTVQVTTDGGSTWTTAATNPAINDAGQIILYWNGTGWSSTRPADITSTRSINGVRYNVTKLGAGRNRNGEVVTYTNNGTEYSTTGANSFFSLISLGAHLEMDLSDRIISVDDTFDYAESSQLYPVGTLTTNIANVTLWNGDEFFNPDNLNSPVRKVLDANVEMNLEYVYTVNGTKYYVQQFKMYTGPWAGQKSEQVSVQLSDASKFLQEITPNPSIWEKSTVPRLVARICDSVGFVDYNLEKSDRVVDLVVPIFWMDGTQTAWQVLDELAKATQTSIYFDAYGVLQIKSREDAFDETKTPVWTLRGENSGTELADIIDIEQSADFNVNHMTVIYQNTKWETYSNGQPALRVVWEPESETEVLRSSELVNTMLATDMEFKIPAGDANVWPYAGIVNIQGELIRYEGKHYVYYTSGSTRNSVFVTSQDEFEKYERMTPPRMRYMNHFTGRFKVTERGVWNSENKRHPVDAEGYSIRKIFNDSGNSIPQDYGFYHDKKNSKVTINPGRHFDTYKDIMYVTRGAEVDSGYYSYGAMFNFVKEAGNTEQIAGIMIHNNGGREDGYYVEFKPSAKIDAKTRALRHEILVYSRKDGKHYRLGPDKGVAASIVEGVEYDVDIYISDSHNLTVWVNGKKIVSVDVPPAYRNARGGKWGMFAKGQTKVQFEYIYAINRPENPMLGLDDSSFLDRVNGEYTGRQWDREWIFGWRSLTRRQKRNSTRNRRRWNKMFVDDFGPYVHEVREYNAIFDNAPVLHSRLYLTNDWSAVCPEYRADAFTANFVVANAQRKNAVVHGTDTISYAGSSKEVNQAMTVIGQALDISEGEEIVVKNENQIRRRGQIESELSSKWIQNKGMARIIANWMKKHWGDGTEQHEATVFGNPLLEVGDVVAVEFPRKHMSASTHKFFITGISTRFNYGIETTLSLRRVV